MSQMLEEYVPVVKFFRDEVAEIKFWTRKNVLFSQFSFPFWKKEVSLANFAVELLFRKHWTGFGLLPCVRGKDIHAWSNKSRNVIFVCVGGICMGKLYQRDWFKSIFVRIPMMFEMKSRGEFLETAFDSSNVLQLSTHLSLFSLMSILWNSWNETRDPKASFQSIFTACFQTLPGIMCMGWN